MRFIWGLVWIAIGTGVIKYAYQIVQTFGRIDWAESHLSGGLGGTYALYKIVGIILILLGFLYMFGGFGFLLSPLTPLFGG